MQTKTIIQAQANVLRITSLKKGDVIKIVEEPYSNSVEVYFGVVLDLLNNGNNCYIQIAKYKKSYNELSCSIATYSGDKDIALFPATVKEVEEHFRESIEYLKRDIKKMKDKLNEQEEGLEKAIEFTSGELSKKLSNAEFSEMTQLDFEKKKQEAIELSKAY